MGYGIGRIMRMHNSVDAATSCYRWGKKANKRYGGVAGKSHRTTNFEIKDSDRKENA